MSALHERIFSTAAGAPDHPAVIHDAGTVSYGHYAVLIRRMAHELVIEGIQKGDRVGVLTCDKVLYLAAVAAVIRVGGIAVPIPFHSSSDAVLAILREIRPLTLVTTQMEKREYTSLTDFLVCRPILADRIQEEINAADGIEVSRELRPDRIAMLMSLRATDGGILFTNDHTDNPGTNVLFSQDYLMGTISTVAKAEQLSSKSIEYIGAPLDTPLGLFRACAVHGSGGTVVVSDRRRSFIGEHGCSSVSGSAAFFHRLAASHGGTLPHSVTCIDIAGHLDGRDEARLLPEKHSVSVFSHYSCAAMLYVTLTERRHGHGTLGRPREGFSLAACDVNGQPMPAGSAGEIVLHLKSDTPRSVCWPHGDAPEVIRTGEIGSLDETGALSILGDRSELIHSGSSWQSPAPMEEIVRSAYPTCEICIVDIDDPAGSAGTVPVLCYRPSNGETITPAAVASLLGPHAGALAVPRLVCRLDRLPHRGGVIARRQLRQMIVHRMTQTSSTTSLF